MYELLEQSDNFLNSANELKYELKGRSPAMSVLVLSTV